METSFLSALAASSLAALVTSIGIYTIRNFAEWGQRNTTYFICFAAGVLISASFLHIIPKSFSMNPHAPVYLLTGFFCVILLQPLHHRLCLPERPGQSPIQYWDRADDWHRLSFAH
jgi:zinc transporter ZupT